MTKTFFMFISLALTEYLPASDETATGSSSMTALEHAHLVRIDTGDVQLATRYYPGNGIPVVFVHGSFDDHTAWREVLFHLSEKVPNPLILFDRRGHSASTDTAGQGRISEDVADVAALIGHFTDQRLGGRAHIIGHSYGASIATALAQTHPELVESLILYEPPLFGLLTDVDQARQIQVQMKQKMQLAARLLSDGMIEQGTVLFLEQVAFGPGSWKRFNKQTQSTMLANADTWLDQSKDPERLDVGVEHLQAFPRPVSLLGGTESLPAFQLTNARFKNIVTNAQVLTISGAGHGGISTHPAQTARAITQQLSSWSKGVDPRSEHPQPGR